MASAHSNGFSAKFIARKMTWPQRAKPDFLIIGAQKAGTISLWQYLAQHPQIVTAIRKEVHYFDGGRRHPIDNFSYGAKWYLAHFPLRSQLGPGQLTYEATPSYMLNPDVAQRVYEFNPKTKLIAVLRDPVDRAVSHYFHNQRKSYDVLPMLEAMMSEEKRLAGIRPNQNHNDYRHFSYKLRGLYAQQLDPYFDLFPAENILLLESKALFKQPQRTIQKTCDFLGIETPLNGISFQAKNVGLNKGAAPEAVVDYLKDYFRQPNEALFDLIGRKFDWQTV